MKNTQLNNGVTMPSVGLGVYLSKDGQEVINAIHWALDYGYRHIDTAMIYRNEEGVGDALKSATTPRDQVFLTTKIWNTDIREGKTTQALDDSLRRLKTDYVDLILLHWPVVGSAAAWAELETALQAGKARAIGVSNFMPEDLTGLLAGAAIVPAVNQIEFHPYLNQDDVLAACASHDITITAWSPLMQGKFKSEPLFDELAARYGKSPAQVILRWDLQRGVTTIPKSVNQGRIQENFDLFDFELSATDLARIDGLNKEERIGPDPRNFDF